jgi:hypothetical protein
LSLCSLSPLVHWLLPFYQHPNFLLSPSLNLVALGFAIESSHSSSRCSPPPMHYDGRVFSFLNLSAFEYEDSWIVMHWISYFHSHCFYFQVLLMNYRLLLQYGIKDQTKCCLHLPYTFFLWSFTYNTNALDSSVLLIFPFTFPMKNFMVTVQSQGLPTLLKLYIF